jgi:hypothetical protein
MRGAVFPVWVAIGYFLQLCKLSGAEGHGGLVAVDAIGLKGVEPGNALGIKDGVDGFAPVGKAFPAIEGLGKALFAGVGKVVVFDDGAGKAFEAMECGCIGVAEFEEPHFDGVSGEGCAFVLLDPAINTRSAFLPGVV